MPSKKGFASLDPNLHRKIASLGGKAAHARGTAHKFTHDEAVIAGRKGGSSGRAFRHFTCPRCSNLCRVHRTAKRFACPKCEGVFPVVVS